MPEGNNIVLIWLFLLAQAGESNKKGALFLTDTIPFKLEDLAIEFDFEVSVMNLALITLEKFSMIEVFEDIIYIKNWDEYQNIDGLEKIREQTRARVERCRNKQKLLSCSVTSNVTVTGSNGIELDKELDIKKKKETKEKNIYAEFVSMSTEEYQKLVEQYGETNTKQMITVLDNYKGANNKKYASDYRAILNWVVDKVIKDPIEQTKKQVQREIHTAPKGWVAK